MMGNNKRNSSSNSDAAPAKKKAKGTPTPEHSAPPSPAPTPAQLPPDTKPSPGNPRSAAPEDAVSVKATLSLVPEPSTLELLAFISIRSNLQEIETPMTNLSLLGSDKPRSVCVAFSDRTFPRAITVVSTVITQGKKVVVVPTFQHGMSLSSYRTTKGTYGAASSSQGTQAKLTPPSPPKARTKVRNDRSMKLTFSNAVRPFGERIPVYDGRKKFRLDDYQSLPCIHTELAEGAAVAAIFTVSHYLSKTTGHTTLSFNIQDIILLANVDDTDVPGPCMWLSHCGSLSHRTPL
ncbi:hypothetical protein DXG01_013447 [Tephrocybe rancida]|nr:hypothetical protein DXG01_013447 [Tephrocybe rancida]